MGAEDWHGTETGGRPDWADLDLSAELITTLIGAGFERPTALQFSLLPGIGEERDVLIEAPARTGRTIAIGAAVAELVNDCTPGDDPVVLIATSSDDRCLEIAAGLETCGAFITRTTDGGIRYAIVSELGSADWQAQHLTEPLDVVLGTPRRMNALISAGKLAASSIEMAIIDQADDIAIGDEAGTVVSMLDRLPGDRQLVVLAGALLPPVMDLATEQLRDPVRPSLPTVDPVGAVGVTQRAIAVGEPTPHVISRVMRAMEPDSAVVITHESGLGRLRQHFGLLNWPVRVESDIDRVPADRSISTVIAAALPTWTDGYAHLLAGTMAVGAQNLILLATPSHRHLLRAFGRIGGVQLNAAPLPGVEGLDARRLQRTEDMVREQLSTVSAQPTPRFLAAVQRLSTDYDVADVAAAAFDLAHRALLREISPGADLALLLQSGAGRAPVHERPRQHRSEVPIPSRRKGGDRRQKDVEPGMIRLFVAAGYNYGVRPGDIVGAFAGESGLSGREIGNIDIRESFTLVEVPEDSADDVIEAMKTGTIKGRQIEVRRERY